MTSIKYQLNITSNLIIDTFLINVLNIEGFSYLSAS